MGQKEFQPVGERSAIRYYFDVLTGRQTKREKQDIENVHKYMGVVRKVDDRTLQLSTSWEGERGEQDVIAGACRLAFETGSVVSIESASGYVGTVSPEMAKDILSQIAMGIPDEMHDVRVNEGKPTNETLNYCAARVVAIMESYDEDARFYDSIMYGKDIREFFSKMHKDFKEKRASERGKDTSVLTEL